MDSRRPPTHTLHLTTDRANAQSTTAALLHTIFFHRLFTALTPSTHDILDLTLPQTTLPDLSAAIQSHTNTLVRALDSPASKTPTGTLVLQFLEKKRAKKSGWFVTKADEETVWEVWAVEVSVVGARSESEARRVRRKMESSLQQAVLRVLEVVNEDRSYIPPITSTEGNPFPWHMVVNPRGEGWGSKIGIF